MSHDRLHRTNENHDKYSKMCNMAKNPCILDAIALESQTSSPKDHGS